MIRGSAGLLTALARSLKANDEALAPASIRGLVLEDLEISQVRTYCSKRSGPNIIVRVPLWY